MGYHWKKRDTDQEMKTTGEEPQRHKFPNVPSAQTDLLCSQNASESADRLHQSSGELRGATRVSQSGAVLI